MKLFSASTYENFEENFNYIISLLSINQSKVVIDVIFMSRFSFFGAFFMYAPYFSCSLAFYVFFYQVIKIIEQLVATKMLQYHFSLPFIILNLVENINLFDSVINDLLNIPLQEYLERDLLYFLHNWQDQIHHSFF